MKTKVEKLPFDAQFAAAFDALCAQNAVLGLKFMSAFVAPGTTTVVLLFTA
jgi:hypothetical protein